MLNNSFSLKFSSDKSESVKGNDCVHQGASASSEALSDSIVSIGSVPEDLQEPGSRVVAFPIRGALASSSEGCNPFKARTSSRLMRLMSGKYGDFDARQKMQEKETIKESEGKAPALAELPVAENLLVNNDATPKRRAHARLPVEEKKSSMGREENKNKKQDPVERMVQYFYCQKEKDKRAAHPLKASDSVEQKRIDDELRNFQDCYAIWRQKNGNPPCQRLDFLKDNPEKIAKELLKTQAKNAHDLLLHACEKGNAYAAFKIIEGVKILQGKESSKQLSDEIVKNGLKEFSSLKLDKSILKNSLFWGFNDSRWSRLISQSGLLNISGPYSWGTPLLKAITHSPTPDSVRNLLEAGADPNVIDENGCAVLHLFYDKYECIKKRVEPIKARMDKLKVLLKHDRTDPDVLFRCPWRGSQSFLHQVVMKGCLSELKAVLDNTEVKINMLSGAPLSYSPLAVAAKRFLSPGGMHYKDLEEIILELLRKGGSLVFSDAEKIIFDSGQDIDLFLSRIRRTNEESEAEQMEKSGNRLHKRLDSFRDLDNLKSAYLDKNPLGALKILQAMKKERRWEERCSGEHSFILHDPSFWLQTRSSAWRKMVVGSFLSDLNKTFSRTEGASHGFSPLALACLVAPDEGAVDDLIKLKADPNQCGGGNDKKPVLHALLDRRLRPSHFEYTAGDASLMTCPLRQAQLEKLYLLLKEKTGTDPNQLSESGQSLLNILVLDKTDSVPAMKMLLNTSRILVNELSSSGNRFFNEDYAIYYERRPGTGACYLSPLAEAANLFLQSHEIPEYLERKMGALRQVGAELVLSRDKKKLPIFCGLDVDKFIKESGIQAISDARIAELENIMDENSAIGTITETAPFSEEGRIAEFKKLVERVKKEA